MDEQARDTDKVISDFLANAPSPAADELRANEAILRQLRELCLQEASQPSSEELIHRARELTAELAQTVSRTEELIRHGKELIRIGQLRREGKLPVEADTPPPERFPK